MMRYRQGLIGFIIGAMLFSTIGVFAEGLTVLLNPYPIIFNEQPVEVESYNINGRTFLSLGDIVKLIGGTAKLNEVTKVIEVNTDIGEVKTMNSTAAIEYDPVTGLPVGAEYIQNEKDGRSYKTIKYNGDIYISTSDLKRFFRIESKFVDGYGRTFTKNGQLIYIDSNDKSTHFFADSVTYYKMILFENYMGE